MAVARLGGRVALVGGVGGDRYGAALPDSLLENVSILTPNRTEAESLAGYPLLNDDTVAAAARDLQRRGPAAVIIKLGADGVCWTEGPPGSEPARFRPAFPVTAVDTVGAGDAFNGALVVALAEGRPLAEAVGWGLAVIGRGAQPSLPDRAALLKLLEAGRA